MRIGKKERLKKKAIKSLIKNNAIIYATSSIYSPMGLSLYGLNDSKYLYIKENQENRIISLIDKNNKKRLDKKLKVC